MKKLAIVNIPTDHALKALIQEAAPEIDFHFINAGESCDMIPQAQIVFGMFPPSVFHGCRKLEWVQLVSSGADALLKSGVLDDQVIITSATGSYGEAIAEFMMAQILTLCYNLHAYRDSQRLRRWEDFGYPHTIMGKTALIVGLGDIGCALARRLHAFGAYTIGIKRTKKAVPDWLDELHISEETELDTLFARADILAVCIPATDQTRQMLNNARIMLLKQDAILVNAGRGSTIDEPALISALYDRRILGAALDVFTTEPLPQDSPLWNLSNVLVTPHIAGHDFAPIVLEKTVNLFLRNLAAYRAGNPLENAVDRTQQYCIDRVRI